MRAAAVALAALTLVGCEGGGDPVESALREAAAANHAAVTKETVVDTAPVSDRDSAAVARLLTAERQALAAAEAALVQAKAPQVRRLAEASRDAHRSRIAELEAWRPTE
ncbi:DUF305 domain-containing protein [Brevundimonas sp.]|uniref:DUF305 domain-containing protein n=1 Tax=Brevundimonas sp. TaxID=1871086 RepID=UPI0035B3BD6A